MHSRLWQNKISSPPVKRGRHSILHIIFKKLKRNTTVQKIPRSSIPYKINERLLLLLIIEIILFSDPSNFLSNISRTSLQNVLSQMVRIEKFVSTFTPRYWFNSSHYHRYFLVLICCKHSSLPELLMNVDQETIFVLRFEWTDLFIRWRIWRDAL